MHLAFYFAGEITQVLDAIPWVRCASGNVKIIMQSEKVVKTCLYSMEDKDYEGQQLIYH